MTDIEMKDANKASDDDKKKDDSTAPEEPSDCFYELKKCLVLLEKASSERDFKMCATLTKQFKRIRRLFNLQDALLVLEHFLPDLFKRMQLQAKPSLLNPDEDVETKLHCTKARMEELTKIPEVHMFIYVMVLMKLIDDGDFKYAKEFGDFIFARMRNVNRRTMDFLAAKAYYFAAVAYEKLGLLSELRPTLFEIYKSCCLHLDQIGQATIMNILIRSFLQQNLIEQARNFISKTTFPEHVSNNQYARYLYYVGRIKAIQLEYSSAQTSLIQALRKAPEVGALGFRVQVQKLLVIVELLMGEVPERSIFAQEKFVQPLAPYFQIVSNVKQGDMEKFKSLVTRFQNLFKMDKNLSLVQRLKHTVIKFGLKKINIAYSRISLADIQSKLGLESVEETEQIVAKAIRDGVIEASISHDNQWMQSLQIVDLYSSNEPQQILHKRIQFTMQLHADAVKSLSYPQKDDKKDYGDFGDLDDNKDGDKDLLLSLLEEMGFEGDFD